MSENERIIANVNATMDMGEMPLTQEDKERIRECLEGKVNFQDAVELLVKKYKQKQVV